MKVLDPRASSTMRQSDNDIVGVASIPPLDIQAIAFSLLSSWEFIHA